MGARCCDASLLVHAAVMMIIVRCWQCLPSLRRVQCSVRRRNAGSTLLWISPSGGCWCCSCWAGAACVHAGGVSSAVQLLQCPGKACVSGAAAEKCKKSEEAVGGALQLCSSRGLWACRCCSASHWIQLIKSRRRFVFRPGRSISLTGVSGWRQRQWY